MNLPVLHRDEHIVVIDKPANMLVHRNEWATADEPFVLQCARDQLGQRVDLVHRLDRATSGVLVLSFGTETTRTLSAAFAAHAVEKRYFAVVRGHPEDAWTVERALKGERGEQSALTAFRTLGRVVVDAAVGRYPTARYAWVEARPTTGRRHQIRRHAAGANHPIVGDVAHGDRHHNHFVAQRFGVARLCLHAASITFPHPADGRLVTVESPIGGDLADLIGALRFGDRCD